MIEWVYVACGGALGAIFASRRQPCRDEPHRCRPWSAPSSQTSRGRSSWGCSSRFGSLAIFPASTGCSWQWAFSARTPLSRRSPSLRRRASSRATSGGRRSTSAGASPWDSPGDWAGDCLRGPGRWPSYCVSCRIEAGGRLGCVDTHEGGPLSPLKS